jgi:hypothetical protein
MTYAACGGSADLSTNGFEETKFKFSLLLRVNRLQPVNGCP